MKKEQIYKLFKGYEKYSREKAIERLMVKGYTYKTASAYYEAWRKHYVTTNFNIT